MYGFVESDCSAPTVPRCAELLVSALKAKSYRGFSSPCRQLAFRSNSVVWDGGGSGEVQYWFFSFGHVPGVSGTSAVPSISSFWQSLGLPFGSHFIISSLLDQIICSQGAFDDMYFPVDVESARAT